MATNGNGRNAAKLRTLRSAKKDAAPRVGSHVAVSEEDMETLATAEKRLERLHAELGTRRVDYVRFEQQAMATIAKSQEEYHALVLTVARKLTIDVDSKTEKWRFADGSFTRTA